MGGEEVVEVEAACHTYVDGGVFKELGLSSLWKLPEGGTEGGDCVGGQKVAAVVSVRAGTERSDAQRTGCRAGESGEDLAVAGGKFA